jgi:hypothetical protein
MSAKSQVISGIFLPKLARKHMRLHRLLTQARMALLLAAFASTTALPLLARDDELDQTAN